MKPLALLLRPENLEDFIGQRHLLENGRILDRILNSEKPVSLVFWGPPGCGKTTLAYIIAKKFQLPYYEISAVIMGIPQVKKIIQSAQKEYDMFNKPTLLFVDEIHRFNKAQQDAFLPYLENGSIIIIGATTENPSFSLNNALLSRVKVLTFKNLIDEDLEILIQKAKEKTGLEFGIEVQKILIKYSSGDARKLLNTLEIFLNTGKYSVNADDLKKAIEGDYNLSYDKKGEYAYDMLSAFHKSLRGSDADASVYWMFRMLNSGEDPLVLVRRMTRFASEDVGLADPYALTLAISTLDAVRFLGMPEADNAMIQLAVYLALAPKSNSIYKLGHKIKELAYNTGNDEVPMHIRNAPTSFMKEAGYGEGYKYPHDYAYGFTPQQYLPDKLKGKSFFEPKDVGQEKRIKSKYEWIQKEKTKYFSK